MITAAELMVRVGAETSGAERALSSMGKSVQNAGRAMTTTGALMTAGITAPLLGIAAAALNSAADFEQSMNVLQQVSGASTETMEEMTQAALRLGAETSFSAGEAAEGMLELAKAGMDTNEVLASISGVMDLAAAGGIALADAANITANALNAFSLEASEADRVANLLAGGANASSADITDLAQGLAQAGFAFANANQPIENLVASLALLTNVGLTGSDAGTALKNAFMRLMNPTKEARAVMKALNLEFYDASGQMKALPEMIDMMNDAFADMTPQQRDAALSTLFLSDGMKAMIPLLDAGSAGFNEMVAAVSEQGQASAVAGARMKGLRGAIEYLKGSIDSFLIGAARPFLDFIGDVIRQGADLLTAVGQLPPEITNAALAFGAVLAVAGPLVAAIGGVISVFGALNPIILAVTVAVAALAAAWSSDFMGIQGAAQSALDAVSGLWTTVSTAPATTTALTAIQTFFSDIATQATTMGTAVATAFSNTNFPTLAELWADFKAGDFEALAAKITSTAYNLMVNLDSELHITATAKDLGQKLLNIVVGLPSAIAQAAIDFTTAAAKWGEEFRFYLWLNTPDMTTAATQWASSFLDYLNLYAPDFTTTATTWASSFKDYLDLYAPDFTTQATTWANSFKDSLNSSPPDMIGAAKTWADKLLADLQAFGINFDAVIVQWTESLKASDWGPAGAAVGEVISQIFSLGFFSASTWTSIQFLLNQWAIGIGMAIGSALSNSEVLSHINDFLNELDTSIGEFMRGIFQTLETNVIEWFNTSSIGEWLGSLGTFDWTTLIPKFDWTTFLPDITWADFVPDVGWDDFVPDVGWADFVPDINWSTFIPIKLAWPDFIPTVLSWDTFLDELDWATFISALVWSTFIPDLFWTIFVPKLNWVDFIADIVWSTFIPGVGWSTFISDISWSSFVPEISWSSFIPDINWGDFVSTFTGGGGGSDETDAEKPGTAGVAGAGFTYTQPAVSRPYYAPAAATVSIGAVHIHNDMDVEVLAATIARRIAQGGRR